jgi:hypothetical protein
VAGHAAQVERHLRFEGDLRWPDGQAASVGQLGLDHVPAECDLGPLGDPPVQRGVAPIQLRHQAHDAPGFMVRKGG